MTGNEGVPHTIVVSMDRDVTPSQFLSPRPHCAENCEKSHSKMIVFLFDTLIIVKVCSVTSSEKKVSFSPKLLTRTAPIPAVTFSALGSCYASVKNEPRLCTLGAQAFGNLEPEQFKESGERG